MRKTYESIGSALIATGFTLFFIMLFLGTWGALSYIFVYYRPTEVHDAMSVTVAIVMAFTAAVMLFAMIAGIAFTAKTIYSKIREKLER